MRIAVIARIFGILLTVFSLTLLPPIAVSLWYHDNTHTAFSAAFVITLVTGLFMWLPVHDLRQELRTRDGFVVTSLFWLVLGSFGSLPLIISPQPDLGVTDSIFESISGLTTTGATVITGLDSLPPAILYYRQQLQWFGGIGVIVIALAILPMLGIGGMQLYKAEIPGPVKDTKLTPRIAETARALIVIYVILTILCGLGYWWAGMTAFDAIGHAFSTVANGGFSTHDASMGFYANNHAIMAICIVFMFTAAINFGLHFFAFRNRSLRHYWQDSEFRFWVMLTLCAALSISLYLWYLGMFTPSGSFLHGFFQVVSIGTTAGFASENFSAWPAFLPYVLLLLGILGACAGSTCGGIKAVRGMLIMKSGLRELNRLVHANAVIPIKVNRKIVPERVTDAVWGFFAVYILSFFVFTVIVMATGENFVTAFSTVASCLSNIGPALGDAAAHYGSVNEVAKWFLILAMLMGRLEIFTLLVLLTPAFWRH
ncbi:trk system potassium uptake protein TrkH [Microbulbifer donghaiensis]|uniref:Trk system potassium uptake protein n=1 Tax=Microbulbifer donghaiensis TaxID=494016 RepID=A0A1M5ARK0_9GAMM|nr:TrkH family potassium uptake protein [Microbulbifer donghaiensis]SHF32804.1 trk system potassium uptake protein TrkH [Microbulbifer donghaiensis]